MISTTCVNSRSLFQCPCASHSVKPGKRGVLAEAGEHPIRVALDDGGVPHGRADERFRDGAIEELHERSVIAGGVEEAARLGVHAELRPRPDLEDLFERAEAAGERDETV